MSQRLDEARREAELRLERSRREAEMRLSEVRGALATEVGFAPRKKYLVLLLAAAAGGLALALKKGRKPRRRKLRS